MQAMQLVFLAGLLGLAWPTAQAADPAKQTVQDCWKPAFRAGDAEAVAACYLPAAVMWFPGGSMARGREAIRKGYAQYFAEYTIKSVELRELGRVATQDTATAWGTFEIVMTPRAGGEDVTERGRYSDVSRKVDGAWRYVMDHASDDPQAHEN